MRFLRRVVPQSAMAFFGNAGPIFRRGLLMMRAQEDDGAS
jgi:hypothetical protein